MLPLQEPHCHPSPAQGPPTPAQPQQRQMQAWTCSQTPPWSSSLSTRHRPSMPRPRMPAKHPTSPSQTRSPPPGQPSMAPPAPRGPWGIPSEPFRTPRTPRPSSASLQTAPPRPSPSSSHPLVPPATPILCPEQVSTACSVSCPRHHLPSLSPQSVTHPETTTLAEAWLIVATGTCNHAAAARTPFPTIACSPCRPSF